MNVHFRPLSREEIPLIGSMMQQLYVLDGKRFDAKKAELALTTLLDEPRYGTVWLVTANDDTVGYVILTAGFSVELGGPYIDIDELFIATDHRGSGVGAAAMAFIEAHARKAGIRFVVLEVTRTNLQAHSFYRKLGFAETEESLLFKAVTE